MQKSTRSADCIGGRDFRDRNDAKKGQKTRLPDAERDGLNASLESMRRSSNPKLNEAQLWMTFMDSPYGRQLWTAFVGWLSWMARMDGWQVCMAIMDGPYGWPSWIAFMDGPYGWLL